MTVEKIFYSNYNQAQKAKKKKSPQWNAIYNDIINGEIRITFVNGDDDPYNSQKVKEKKVDFQRKKLLLQKLDDDSMTFLEWKEYLRL